MSDIISSLPTFDQLASMWPAWLALIGLAIVVLICEYKDRKDWEAYQHRMRRREMAERIARRQNQRN